MSEPRYTVLYCTDGWVLAGNLPNIMYDWYVSWDKAEEKQASGEMVIAVWTDPKEGTQHWITPRGDTDRSSGGPQSAVG